LKRGGVACLGGLFLWRRTHSRETLPNPLLFSTLTLFILPKPLPNFLLNPFTLFLHLQNLLCQSPIWVEKEVGKGFGEDEESEGEDEVEVEERGGCVSRAKPPVPEPDREPKQYGLMKVHHPDSVKKLVGAHATSFLTESG
jgi:hypothetical protein